MFYENDIIIFLHIPKTGGTTLRDILIRLYNHKNIVITTRMASSEKTIKSLSAEQKNNTRIVIGHMKFGLHHLFNKNCKYFTILRDPIERVISSYLYVISSKNNPYNLSSNGRIMSIKEYINSNQNPFLRDGQTQLISGILFKDEMSNTQRYKTLQIAKENLLSSFFLVGITEKFNESLMLLKRELGWKQPYYSLANKSKNKTLLYDLINERERELIKYNNRLDTELYEFAKQLFEKKIEKHGSQLEQDLKKFTFYNKLLSPIYAYPRILRKIKRLLATKQKS